jgi:hypothetical protein
MGDHPAGANANRSDFLGVNHSTDGAAGAQQQLCDLLNGVNKPVWGNFGRLEHGTMNR